MNSVTLIGNLGADPEIKHLDSGDAVCNFRIATSRKWKNKNGEKQEKTEWHRIVVWGPQAENCAQYLGKGRQVAVQGEIETRKWQDKEGQDRYTTEIKAFRVEFLGGKQDGSSAAASSPAPRSHPIGGDPDDNVPF